MLLNPLVLSRNPSHQDTSGRVVAYDLLTGSMLGVLALGSNSIGGATATKPENGSGGGETPAEVVRAVVPRAGVVWSEGWGRLAAVMSNEEVKMKSVCARYIPILCCCCCISFRSFRIYRGCDSINTRVMT